MNFIAKYSVFYLFIIFCIFSNCFQLSFSVAGDEDDDFIKSFLQSDSDNDSPESSNNETNLHGNGTESSPIDLKQLLELTFVNSSVRHYHEKLTRLHSNLRNRVKQLKEMQSSMNQLKYSDEFAEKLNITFYGLINSLELSKECTNAFDYMSSELSRKKFWPLNFIDSMELFSTGMLDGTISTFGLYEECLSIKSPEYQTDRLQGKYCLAKVRLSLLDPVFEDEDDPEAMEKFAHKKQMLQQLNMDFEELNTKLKLLQTLNMLNGSYYRVGLCIPSSCASEELERAVNKFIEPIAGLLRKDKLVEIERECSMLDQDISVNKYQVISILLILSLVGLVFLGTCYECYLARKGELKSQNILSRYLVAFSARSSTNSLFESIDHDNDRLNIVGVILLFLIVLEFIVRSYVMPMSFGMMTVKRFQKGMPKEYFSSKKFIFLRSALLASGTYSVIFGLTLGFNMCKNRNSEKFKLSWANYAKFVMIRWCSLARRLIGPILLIYLLPLVGDGPVWHYFDQILGGPCKNNLLPSIFFFSNYEKSVESVCNPSSIMLSAIFWLSLASPVVLYLRNISGKNSRCNILVPTFIVVSFLFSLTVRLYFHLPAVPPEVAHSTSLAQTKRSFLHYPFATDQLVGSFLFGLLLGYLIACKSNLSVGSRLARSGITLGAQCLVFVAVLWNEQFNPTIGGFSEFNFFCWLVLAKIMVAVGFGWTLYNSSTGKAGPMSKLCSWSLLRPLSKLAIGVYLNTTAILSFRQLTKKEVTPLNHTEILTDDISDLVIAFVISYIFYILIERPLYHWIRITFGSYELELEKPKQAEVTMDSNGNVGQENAAFEDISLEVEEEAKLPKSVNNTKL